MNDDTGECDCDMCRVRLGELQPIVPPVRPYSICKPSATGGLGFQGGLLRPHATATSQYTYSHSKGFHQAKKPGADEYGARIRKSRLLDAAREYDGPYINKLRQEELPRTAAGDWVRVQEMVWARVDSIASRRPDLAAQGVEISWWPGIVMEREYYTQTTVGGELPAAGEGLKEGSVQVRPYVEWRIHLFGIRDFIFRRTEELIPWLGYRPSTAVFSTVKLTPESSLLTRSTSKPGKCRRTDLKNLKNIELALAPYAYALQLAAGVVMSWSLLDAWINPELPDEFQGKRDTKKDQGMIMNLTRAVLNYQGLFLGGEKIWVGDLVRLRTEGVKALALLSTRRSDRDRSGSSGSDEEPGERVWQYPTAALQDRRLVLLINTIYRHKENDQIFCSGSIYEVLPAVPGVPLETDWPPDVQGGMPAPPGFSLVRATPRTSEHHIALEQCVSRSR
jgi:hypothetical protein